MSEHLSISIEKVYWFKTLEHDMEQLGMKLHLDRENQEFRVARKNGICSPPFKSLYHVNIYVTGYMDAIHAQQ